MPVAADGVDVAAQDGAGGDEAVDQYQHGEDQAGDGERGAGTAGGEEVRGVEDGGADEHQLQHGDPNFGDLGAERLGPGPGAQFAHHDEDRDCDTHQDREVVVAGVRTHLGQVAGADVLEVVGYGNGVGLAHELVEAAEEEHAGQRHDEGGDAHIRGPPALPGADDRTQHQAQQDACPPRDAPVADGEGDGDADERGDGADREVDVACDDHQHHADGQDQDVGVAVEEVDDVAGGQRPAFGGELEENDQGHEGKDHAELAGVAAKQLFEGVHGVSPCVRKVLDGPEGQAAFRVAEVISFIRLSWLASSLFRTPVMAPSKMV